MFEEFRIRARQVSGLLEIYDLYGTSGEQEQEEFWEQFVSQGQEMVAVFNRIVKLRGGSARERILDYLQRHVGEVVEGETLAVVAGIPAWARRVRELHTEKGYCIATGDTDPHLRPGQYRLERLEPDRERAEEWRRKKRMRSTLRRGGS